ncbi:hypothetical protein JKP88DRAFT_71701 [Tribonema minus]|uniref:Uncharacterized protein n=1 Tax=Tribonema minus TaxID=303371 RepID=A0A835YR16_9STRA|nr:hypothetical protein JKP88DRAFT_71701 [Tribonema minus]
MCDYGFLMYLNGRIGEAGPDSEEGTKLSAVAQEINVAMQRRLVAADANLRAVLANAPDLKKMEADLRRLFRTGQADMAFMVVLNMNLAQAREAGPGAEGAVAVLTHLNTAIMEMQDTRVAPEVRLLRMLMRASDDDNAEKRRDLLKEQLDLSGGGGADSSGLVTPDQLRDAIRELQEQATQIEKVSKEYDTGLTEKLRGLLREIDEVLMGTAPKLNSDKS